VVAVEHTLAVLAAQSVEMVVQAEARATILVHMELALELQDKVIMAALDLILTIPVVEEVVAAAVQAQLAPHLFLLMVV
jgi:dihydroxyacetone kinase DhaKLM complex PTS-EIIA-like component DhaM